MHRSVSSLASARMATPAVDCRRSPLGRDIKQVQQVAGSQDLAVAWDYVDSGVERELTNRSGAVGLEALAHRGRAGPPPLCLAQGSLAASAQASSWATSETRMAHRCYVDGPYAAGATTPARFGIFVAASARDLELYGAAARGHFPGTARRCSALGGFLAERGGLAAPPMRNWFPSSSRAWARWFRPR